VCVLSREVSRRKRRVGRVGGGVKDMELEPGAAEADPFAIGVDGGEAESAAPAGLVLQVLVIRHATARVLARCIAHDFARERADDGSGRRRLGEEAGGLRVLSGLVSVRRGIRLASWLRLSTRLGWSTRHGARDRP